MCSLLRILGSGDTATLRERPMTKPRNQLYAAPGRPDVPLSFGCTPGSEQRADAPPGSEASTEAVHYDRG